VTVVAEPEPKRGPSLVVQIAVLLVLTAIAAGIGWFSGGFLGKSQPPAAATDATANNPPPAADTATAAGHGQLAGAGNAAANSGRIVDLAPITTNLAMPDTIWIRLELSLVLDKEPKDLDLVLTIQQDIMAYIRTVKLIQVQGASGYQHLKSDILERAKIRSQGLVKDVLVRTMIFE